MTGPGPALRVPVLAELLGQDRPAELPVALVAGQVRTWAQFQLAAAQVAAQVGPGRRQRWVLACEDAWAFAAGWFGLLQAGCDLVLPANFQPDTVARLAAQADGVLRALPEPGRSRVEPGPGVAVDATVAFWTSGSTGEPKVLVKCLAQLDAELAVLEAEFGGRLGAGPVAGTVPHHHIYGCLFRILWPLVSGRPFLAEPCGDPARFRQAMALQPVLVSSPAHLSRLPQVLSLSALVGRPRAVFSSGGPLQREPALEWRRWLPAGVVEIYGSTETGGVAWRCQGPELESAAWTPLADVQISLAPDSALVVSSFRAGPAPLRLEDAAERVAEGRFLLRGRLDRILKLEEKRVSLPELEAALAGHPWVAQAAVVLVAGPRPVLGAALVLAAAAPAEPAAVVAGLRRHLAGTFEPVALPRRWRFLEALPYDGRGKLPAQALAALFQGPEPRP